MSKYFQYSRKHFEFELRGITIRNNLGFIKDITSEWISQGNSTWERIYSVPTRNKSVDIIIFSSVCVDENKVRNSGKDSVKVIMRWKTKNGYVYKKLAHHYRLETLFDNLSKTIMESLEGVFNLNYKEFNKSL